MGIYANSETDPSAIKLKNPVKKSIDFFTYNDKVNK